MRRFATQRLARPPLRYISAFRHARPSHSSMHIARSAAEVLPRARAPGEIGDELAIIPTCEQSLMHISFPPFGVFTACMPACPVSAYQVQLFLWFRML